MDKLTVCCYFSCRESNYLSPTPLQRSKQHWGKKWGEHGRAGSGGHSKGAGSERRALGRQVVGGPGKAGSRGSR